MNYRNIIGIDRIKIGYTTDKENYEFLSGINDQIIIDGCIRLSSINKPIKPHTKTLKYEVWDKNIATNVLFWIDMGYIHFGNKLNHDEVIIEKYYVWIELHNRILYTTMEGFDDLSVGFYLPVHNAPALGLRCNTITRCEISVDSTCNFASKIKKAIRNSELQPIINGKVVKDRQKIIPHYISLN